MEKRKCHLESVSNWFWDCTVVAVAAWMLL